MGYERRYLPLWATLFSALPGIATVCPALAAASPSPEPSDLEWDLTSDASRSDLSGSRTRIFRDIIGFSEQIELTFADDETADSEAAAAGDAFSYELSQEVFSEPSGPVIEPKRSEAVAGSKQRPHLPVPNTNQSPQKPLPAVIGAAPPAAEIPDDGFSKELYLAEDLQPGDLEWSRQRFRELVGSSDASLAQLDPRYLGGLSGTPGLSIEALRMQDSVSSNGLVAQEPLPPGNRFDPKKTYTVVNGKIVEVSETANIVANQERQNSIAHSPAIAAQNVQQQPPVQPAPASSPLAPQVGQALLDPASLANSPSSVYLTDRQESLPQSGATMRSLEAGKDAAQGAFVRGRVEVPQGIQTSSVIVRVAGTAVETYLDNDGFFELGPFSLGSSLNLLVFDLDSRLNRRIVPMFVGVKSTEKQIRLIRSSDVLELARSFGVQPPLNRSGFCGTVFGSDGGPDFDHQGNATNGSAFANAPEVVLVDPAGQRLPLHFYGPSGLPSASTALTRDGRLCAFDLGEGVYRLFVKGQSLRRSFSISLRNSEFENNLRFDLLPKAYPVIKAFTPVDQGLFGEMVSKSSDPAELTSIPFNSPRQDLWVSGQDKAVWAPVSEYDLVTDAAYAAVTVFDDSERRYVPTAEDLVEIRERDSQSTVLVGADAISALESSKLPLSFHVLSRDTVEGIRNQLDIPEGSSDFLVFGELDTARFLRSEGPFQILMTDIWSAQPIGTVRMMSTANDRILRFAGGNLDSGVFQIGVYNTQGRLIWSSIVRAEKGTHQVISNRN